MDVAALTPKYVGVRELKNKLSSYLEAVKEGQEIIVTDHGKPVARLVQMGDTGDRLAELIARGEATAPTRKRSLRPPIKAKGNLTDFLLEQRR
jgi:prevent-host-death family protein